MYNYEVVGHYKIIKNSSMHHYIDDSFKCYYNSKGNIQQPEKEHRLYTIEIWRGKFADVPENNGYKNWLYTGFRIFKDDKDLSDLLSKNGWDLTYKTIKSGHLNVNWFNRVEFNLKDPSGDVKTWQSANDPTSITQIVEKIHSTIDFKPNVDSSQPSIADLKNEIADLKKRNSELETTISSIKKLVSPRKPRKSKI